MIGKKLLVADDSLTIQKVIKLALSNEGYEIQTISEGNDALQHISVFRPDVILIDVSLPGKTAFEVKTIINQQPDLSNVRFVLMCSAFETIDEVQFKAAGFDERLTKPFDPAHLREVLQKVINETKKSTPEISASFSDFKLDSTYKSPLDLSVNREEQMSQPDQQQIQPPPFRKTTDSPVSIHFEPPDENLVQNVKEDLPIVPEGPREEVADLWDSGQILTPSAETAPLTEQVMSPEQNLDINSQWRVTEPTPKISDPLPFVSRPTADQISEADLTRLQAGLQLGGQPGAQLDTQIQTQVQSAIQKIIEKILPDIAEKIIKQEIHRLLSE